MCTDLGRKHNLLRDLYLVGVTKRGQKMMTVFVDAGVKFAVNSLAGRTSYAHYSQPIYTGRPLAHVTVFDSEVAR